MLPGVDADQGHVGCKQESNHNPNHNASALPVFISFLCRACGWQKLTQQRVLVGSGDDVELLGLRVVAEPAPAAALDGGDLCVELGLELVEAAKVAVDGILECTVGELTAAVLGRGEVLPEERVVDVAAAIKVDGLLEGDGRLDVLLVECVGELLLGGVEAVDVRLVVLGVVQLHDLGADGGLERAVVVREVRKRVLGADGTGGKGAGIGSLDGAGRSGEGSAKHVGIDGYERVLEDRSGWYGKSETEAALMVLRPARPQTALHE